MNLNQMQNEAIRHQALSRHNTLEQLDDLFKLRHREAVNISFNLRQLNLFDERFAGTDAESSDRRAQVVKQITAAKQRHADVQRQIFDLILKIAAILAAERTDQ